MKSVIISFDDNTIYDRKAVEILNKYRLKATFFINSGTLGKPGYLQVKELEQLFKNHEVGSHSINHINLKEASKNEILYEIKEDIEYIESYTKLKVKGFAYPFGNYNKKVIQVLKDLNISYARTITSSLSFDTPKDYYIWHPTLHFSGVAWDSNDRDKRNKGVDFMFNKLEEFLDDEDAPLFHVWLHSWEMKDDLYRWDQFDRFCRILSMEDVDVVTCSEYYKWNQ